MMRRIGDIINAQQKTAICAIHGDYVSENSLRIGWSPCLKCAEAKRKASVLAAIESFSQNQAMIAKQHKNRSTGKTGGKRND